MSVVPRLFRRFLPQLIHMLVLPLFFFLFIIIYRPFDLTAFFGSVWFGVNVAIVTGIIFLCLVATRLMYYYLPLRLNYTLYVLWCFGEVFLASIFCAIYLWVNQNNPSSYLDYFSRSFEFLLFSLAIPYAILALSIRIYDYNNIKNEPENTTRMRFYDVNKNLKFVVTADSILYIGAEENYINIYYTDSGKVKCYVLRSSMRAVDDLCLTNGLVRCHRSYYVNPKHVSVLRKDKDGFVSAELDMDDVMDIPVSKKFYNNLAEML